jgi:hypothetical protein
MAITFIDAAEVTSGTIDLTGLTKQSGDVLIGYCRRNTSNTSPGTPDGWNSIANSNSGSDLAASMRAVYRVSDGTETTATFTNGSRTVVMCYRGVATADPIGHSATAGGSSDVPGLTLEVTDGSSWVSTGAGSANAVANPTAPSSSRRAFAGATGGGGSDHAVHGHDTNGGVASWAGGAMSNFGGNRRVIITFELLAAAAAPAGTILPFVSNKHGNRQVLQGGRR